MAKIQEQFGYAPEAVNSMYRLKAMNPRSSTGFMILPLHSDPYGI